MTTVAVVGATGAVGREMLRTLERRSFPAKRVVALASERSAGSKLPYKGGDVAVEKLAQIGRRAAIFLNRNQQVEIGIEAPDDRSRRDRLRGKDPDTAYTLHVTLRARLKPLAAGLTPRAVLDTFAAIQMLDVHFPTIDGTAVLLDRQEAP